MRPILSRSAVTVTIFALVPFAVVFSQDPPAAPDPAAAPAAAPAAEEGPDDLLKKGRAAFQANDFATAEDALERFIDEYGSEETKEIVRVYTPVVAICKVGLNKFSEALEWIDRAFADPQLDPGFADELAFWKGLCLMQQGDHVAAQESLGAYWANPDHQVLKRHEALLLFAMLYLQQGLPETAAEMLADQIPKIQEQAPEAASRAVVIQFFALIESGQNEEALELVKAQYPRLGEMTQVISFQTLALQLGSQFLEQKKWHDAIACLQRIWPRERLLRYQQEKQAKIENRIAELQRNPSAQGLVFQLQGILKRVEREIANFEKIENFDSALRLRLATAFQGLGRYREAALVMEDMLKNLPPDPVVDAASLALIQCWMEIGRWPKAVEAANLYTEKFGETGKNLPTVLFLKAEALREDFQYGAAQLAFGDLVERFPDDPVAPKATFMEGFLYLQQDDNEGAMFQFDQVEKKYPDSGLVDDSDYWTGMALSFSKEYEAASDHMEAYLERFGTDGKTPKYRKEAIFRIAVCTFSMADYPGAIEKLESFIETYEGDFLTDEAHLLLGDALFGEGEIDRGIEVYARIRPEAGRFFEDAWFKVGKAHKLTEEFDRMRGHFEQFVGRYPESNRMPEAVYWLGWIETQAGEAEKARDRYWEALNLHGNRPSLFSIEDLVLALPKVYKGDGDEGREALLAKLDQVRSQAEQEERQTLALRAAWGRAQILKRMRPEVGEAALVAASKSVDPKKHNPLITVDCADALRAATKWDEATELYIEARKWHPRSIHKDRIYAGLGAIHEQNGEPEEAIKFYEKFEKETALSTRLGEIRLAKARLLAETGQFSRARATLESLLEDQTTPARTKAETLYQIGDNLFSDGDPRKASAYFERVYVMYGKYGELNAKAYWRRGEALEELGMKAEALEVYEELSTREDLQNFDEAKRAPGKVNELESFRKPKAEPETAEVEAAETS